MGLSGWGQCRVIDNGFHAAHTSKANMDTMVARIPQGAPTRAVLEGNLRHDEAWAGKSRFMFHVTMWLRALLTDWI